MKVGVAGLGRMGGFHAQKVVAHPSAELTGIHDISISHMKEKAQELGTRGFDSLDELIAVSDAIVLASPTSTHSELGRKILEAGKHLLIEKPIADSISEAKLLVDLADKMGLVLSVGHIENFNPAFLAAFQMIENPIFVEAHRMSPFVGRGTDVSVVMDLMIHDIEILLRLMGPAKEIRASGGRVLTDEIDIASARIEFEKGVANVTASRISDKPLRKMRFFTKGSYVSIDFGKKEVEAIFQGAREGGLVFEMGGERFTRMPVTVENKDPLYEELDDFISSVESGKKPMVDGHSGLNALEIAESILGSIQGQ